MTGARRMCAALLVHGALLARAALLVCGALLVCAAPLWAADAGRAPLALHVLYPLEGAAIAAVDSTFVFGNVSDPHARLEINGVALPVYRTGGFLAYVPLTTGPMILRLTARRGDDTTSVARHITVAGKPRPLPVTPWSVDSVGVAAIEPSEDREVQTGDAIPFRLRASPGAHAYFELRGARYPMAEGDDARAGDPRVDAFAGELSGADSSRSGIFTGVYIVQPADAFAAERATIGVRSAAGTDSVRLTCVGRITSLDPRVPRIVEFLDSLTVGRTAPGGGYRLFVPRGVRAQCSGSRGTWWRIRCVDDVAVWVPATSVRPLPAGTSLPRPRLGTIRVDEGSRASRVTVTVSPAVPYSVDEDIDPARLRVQLYGAIADVDWIHYTRGTAGSDSADAYIPSVVWSQPTSEIVQLDIRLAGARPWGYAASYAGSAFTLEARRPPAPVEKKHGMFRRSPKPLARMFIAVDAGHGPDTGASGPTGLLERDANLAIAHELGQRLEDLGARVFYTRPDTTGVPLASRPGLAIARGANLLVSVHLNALPDGVNPYLHRGSSVYFYYPHSQRLAECVHDALLARLRLPDFGLYYGNLLLTRSPQLPAILTESTFLMHPDEEEALRDGTRRREIAGAISDGIVAFVTEQSWALTPWPLAPLDVTPHAP